MNIGIVTTWFERGAAYVSKAYEKALEKNNNVFIYARGGEDYGKGDPTWDRPNVTCAPRWSSSFFPGDQAMSRLHFYRWIKKNCIILLIYNEQRDFSLVRDFSKFGVISGAYIDYYTRDTINKFKIYDFLICNTKRHYSVFKNFQKVIFIQWGTDIELFKPSNRILSENENLIFFHSAGYGGVNFRKGTDILVKAFQKVKGRTRLIIHSQVPAIYFGSEIENTIKNDNRVEYIKSSIKAPGIYHLGHVYVYPSRLDGIGLTVPEALSVGLPVVTSNSAPMNEFIENNNNGLLVKINKTQERQDKYYWPEKIPDIDDLAKKMQFYVDNPMIVKIHQKNARDMAVKYFNWDENSRSLSEFISQFDIETSLKPLNCLGFIKLLTQDILRITSYYIWKILKPLKKILIGIKYFIQI